MMRSSFALSRVCLLLFAAVSLVAGLMMLPGKLLAIGFFAVTGIIFTARAAGAEELDVAKALSADAQSILDASPDACVVLDRRGIVLWANAAAREQLGIFSVGNPFSFTLRVPELIRAVEKVGRSGLNERARWSEKVPTSRWYEAFIAPFHLSAAAGANSDGIAIFVRDLTEQERLDRMREDFVANASHELRTPLAALTGFIETLQGHARDDPEARDQFLAIMHTQAERMKRLTDALLSLSRIEMRAHVQPSDLIDVTATVRQAVEMTRSLAREAGVALEVDVQDGQLPIRADSDEIIQLVDNLVENAIKYGGDGGRVVVCLCKQTAGTGETAVISVQDFGKGIAPQHVPRLTERFYRVDVEASRARQGTGLGLAIVKHIVARHRGRLTVRSELGAGSTFTVKIPLDHTAELAPDQIMPI
ncbi:MAG: ATP-binding protein [Pseudomonadota bacterium]